MTIIIPKRESTLIVTPNRGAKINIPKNEIGRPKATQKASRVFKNKERKIKTNSIPCNAFFMSSWVR